MMIRNSEDGGVEFHLSKDEAERVQVDHGEMEIVLPVADTLDAVAAMGAALRGLLVDGAEAVIEPLPD